MVMGGYDTLRGTEERTDEGVMKGLDVGVDIGLRGPNGQNFWAVVAIAEWSVMCHVINAEPKPTIKPCRWERKLMATRRRTTL